jgi:hypothetical protein
MKVSETGMTSAKYITNFKQINGGDQDGDLGIILKCDLGKQIVNINAFLLAYGRTQ